LTISALSAPVKRSRFSNYVFIKTGRELFKNTDVVKVNKSQSDHYSPFTSNEMEKSDSTADFLYHAIENADGVPFQLIFGLHIGDGHYLNVGSGLQDLLDIAPGDFTERMFNEMIEEVVPLSDDIPRDPAEARRKFISGEIKSYRAEVLIRLPGGEKRWIRDASLPLTDEETGKVIGAFGILYDISNYKNSVITTREAEKSAAEYDRLKSAFLQNISHEIRTPLNAIVGFSTLLGEPGLSETEQQKFTDIITSNTDHLLRVMTDIVEFSKIEANVVTIRKERVNISDILHMVYDRYVDQALGKGMSLCLTSLPDGDEITVVTDGSKVTQVLENLVDNAIKFTMAGHIDFGCEMKEGKVEFYVSDTGPGIPLEQQDKVFKRFHQDESGASRSNVGIGLGLPIAAAYVEMLGGDICFTSEPGNGTVFRFSIPAENAG
jgi:signal transduction histidine kinase